MCTCIPSFYVLDASSTLLNCDSEKLLMPLDFVRCWGGGGCKVFPVEDHWSTAVPSNLGCERSLSKRKKENAGFYCSLSKRKIYEDAKGTWQKTLLSLEET